MEKNPLAYRMRPRTLDEVIGQEHIIGKNTSFYRMIQQGHVPSMLLYGEPGIGKTSLAYAIAGSTKKHFITLNATTAGKKDIEHVVNEANVHGEVLLFLDEIHAFTRSQQNYLLEHTERALITLIGATTENPFHDVNPAIRSRCNQIKQLKPIKPSDIILLLKRTLEDQERGLGNLNIAITEEQLDTISNGTNGDVRTSLNLLEDIVYASKVEDDVYHVEDETIEEFLINKGFSHDKNGSAHYDVLSSLQKAIRGSDTDAAVFYLARLIEAGDLTSICRRLVVIAYEDCGLASDMGYKTYLACEASKSVGFPEARIILSNIVIELCLSAKSNSSYLAINKALEDVRNGAYYEIPSHLKDNHYRGAKQLGYGIGYVYPHDHPLGSFGGWVKQQYLPDELKDRQYYVPKDAGKEKNLGAIYLKLRGMKEK
ncbi:replication-associated recombination protein A [Bacillus luti]|nr:replication-associated recombination protein A [Bacillus cereus]HDR8330084.1 replication-associated recombination protein A [Bacillus cereus]HDR8337056.1 replication-associated recombination protein A [Bacillus cereus]